MINTIKFIPSVEEAKNYPPTSIKKEMPDWYRNLPTKIGEVEINNGFLIYDQPRTPFISIKKCIPVLDFMSSGYVLKAYSELNVSKKELDEEQVFPKIHLSTKTPIGTHSHKQCPVNFQGEKKNYFKFRSGWKVRTPSGYSCLFYQSPYMNEERFTLFPAIVDTDVYDAEILFPGYINKGYDDLNVSSGTNLIVVLPFKRDSWISEISSEIFREEDTSFAKKKAKQMFDVYKMFFHQRKYYK